MRSFELLGKSRDGPARPSPGDVFRQRSSLNKIFKAFAPANVAILGEDPEPESLSSDCQAHSSSILPFGKRIEWLPRFNQSHDFAH